MKKWAMMILFAAMLLSLSGCQNTKAVQTAIEAGSIDVKGTCRYYAPDGSFVPVSEGIFSYTYCNLNVSFSDIQNLKITEDTDNMVTATFDATLVNNNYVLSEPKHTVEALLSHTENGFAISSAKITDDGSMMVEPATPWDDTYLWPVLEGQTMQFTVDTKQDELKLYTPVGATTNEILVGAGEYTVEIPISHDTVADLKTIPLYNSTDNVLEIDVKVQATLTSGGVLGIRVGTITYTPDDTAYDETGHWNVDVDAEGKYGAYVDPLE